MNEIRLNIHEAQARLSEHLDNLRANDRILLCQQDNPVAEVRLIHDESASPNGCRIGVAAGEFEVPDSFFEPLPDELLDALVQEPIK